jgi:hypothetical protein
MNQPEFMLDFIRLTHVKGTPAHENHKFIKDNWHAGVYDNNPHQLHQDMLTRGFAQYARRAREHYRL